MPVSICKLAMEERSSSSLVLAKTSRYWQRVWKSWPSSGHRNVAGGRNESRRGCSTLSVSPKHHFSTGEKTERAKWCNDRPRHAKIAGFKWRTSGIDVSQQLTLQRWYLVTDAFTQWQSAGVYVRDTDFVTSILASQFSATSENTNKTFRKFPASYLPWLNKYSNFYHAQFLLLESMKSSGFRRPVWRGIIYLSETIEAASVSIPAFGPVKGNVSRINGDS
jgi:hypothetical protein